MNPGLTRRNRVIFVAVSWGATAFCAAQARSVDLVVTSVEPSPRTLIAPIHAPIVAHFDKPVNPTTISANTFKAFGRWSGAVSGSYQFLNGGQTVSLRPDRPLSSGEQVMVVLSHDIEATDGSFLRSAGYSWQYWITAQSATMSFTEIDRLDTRTVPTTSSRAYGGIASDMNRDTYLDITIVNEDTADLRVFLNLADRSGLFAPFIQPTFPVGDRASPSEPADFNGDGHVDICVANINDNTVSVLLGNGNGKFGPQQIIPVGSAPRGIAVLDADGDGDLDVVNTNTLSNSMSIMFNDGSGVFGAASFFEAGVAGEWALAAADMNEDGILDLIIGGRSSQTIAVNTGNGDGTFSFASTQSAGGSVWMLTCGDVNGDQHEDVCTANSTSGNGAILTGNGAGQLAAPTTHSTDPFPLATDFGDLDGDGDLDWVTASFSGDWFIFENNGVGVFSFLQEIDAPIAASCSLALDFDNDGDLDLALIDELADEVILMRNGGVGPCISLGDFDVSGTCDGLDLSPFVAAIMQGANWKPAQLCSGDFDGNGAIGTEDIGPFVACLLN
ncbi:MAG: VCBS repeat-containing protein [Planctomycetota bacterium]|nr:VCBS repeat-containing protein [Planctomycetota bacterium]